MARAGEMFEVELVPGLDRALTDLEVAAADRCAVHARLLRSVLAVQQQLDRGGCGLAGASQVALLLQISETAASHLITQAELLRLLPGAWEAVQAGLLGPEQAAAFTRTMTDLPVDVIRLVWEQLQARLIDDQRVGAVLPPARLCTLLTRWATQADPQAGEQRREQAQDRAEVDYRKRPDGLVDLFATGISGPNAQAVLSRIRARALAWGAGDERPAGRRRLEAMIDLLLGRDQLPMSGREVLPVFCHHPDSPDRTCTQTPGQPCRGHLPHDDHTDRAPRGCASGTSGTGGTGAAGGTASCGCRIGTPAPCGVDVHVLIPLSAALGRPGQLATLVGHGVLEPDLTAAVLANRPRLSPVWIDDGGTPVAHGPSTTLPDTGDPAATLRRALLELAALPHSGPPPPPLHPRHPHDHPPDPQRAGTAHPVGAAGAYRVPAGLRSLTCLRAPLCEWPGCGHRATRCDQDHDTAWPAGPTCACNLGPLCRRHHQIKQLLFTKTRQPGNTILWKDATGRTWTSPSQHAPPAPTADAAEVTPGELDRLLRQADALGMSLSPAALAEELWIDTHGTPDPADPYGPGQMLDTRPGPTRRRQLTALHPDHPERAGHHLSGARAGTDPDRYTEPWGLDLDNPCGWD